MLPDNRLDQPYKALVGSGSSASEQNVDPNQPWKACQTWGADQWRDFFSNPNIPTGLIILKQFSLFATANPTEARRIHDSVDIEKLSDNQKSILKKIFKLHLQNENSTVDDVRSEPLQALHAAPSLVPATSAVSPSLASVSPVVISNENGNNASAVTTVPENSTKGWKYIDWRNYFVAANKSTDLSFAGNNFHTFAKDYPQAAQNLLDSLRVGKFNDHGKRIIKALKKDVENRIYRPVSIPKEGESQVSRNIRTASSTKSAREVKIAPEGVIEPIRTISEPTITYPPTTAPVEPPALDTSSWDKSKWQTYFRELRQAQGTNTLKTFGPFARANPQSAIELLQNVQYGNLSEAQTAVMRTLCERYLKMSLSPEKPTGAEVLARTSQINSSQTFNPGIVEVSTPQVPKTARTQVDWHDYFRQLDKTYPDDQFMKDMAAFTSFALEDPGAAKTAVGILDRRKLFDEQVIEIRRALGATNPEIIPDNSIPTNSGGPTFENYRIEPPTSSTNRGTRSIKGQQRSPAAAKVENRTTLPIRISPSTKESVIEEPRPAKNPKAQLQSSFNPTLEKLVSKISVDLYHATSQVFDINHGSSFADAKFKAISRILKDLQAPLAELTEAVKNLDAKALTRADRQQLREIAEDLSGLSRYSDDKTIHSLINQFETEFDILVGKTLMRKRPFNLSESDDEPRILSLPTLETTPEPEKPRKESLELIHELGVEIDIAMKVKDKLTVEDKAHLTDWLTGNLGDLEKHAAEDSFLPPELNYQQAMPTLKYYAAILDLINRHDAVSLASKDSSDALGLKLIIEEKVNKLNQYLLTKIEDIDWDTDTELKGLFIQAFSAPYQLS